MGDKLTITGEHVLTMRYVCAPAIFCGPTRSDLVISPAKGGSLQGSGINAKLVDGSDWLVPKRGGITCPNVRIGWDFGDTKVGCQYSGIYIDGEKSAKYHENTGEVTSTNFDDQYLRTSITFDVDPAIEKYAWLARSIFVGKGRFERADDGAISVEYHIFKM